jgi:hypothetical protein
MLARRLAIAPFCVLLGLSAKKEGPLPVQRYQLII